MELLVHAYRVGESGFELTFFDNLERHTCACPDDAALRTFLLDVLVYRIQHQPGGSIEPVTSPDAVVMAILALRHDHDGPVSLFCHDATFFRAFAERRSR